MKSRSGVWMIRHCACALILVLLVSCGSPEMAATRLDPTVVEFGGTTTILTVDEYDPEYQNRILEDGIVSFAEYERAVMDTVSCLEAMGYEAHVEEELGGMALSIAVVGTGGDSESENRERQAYFKCENHYLSNVQQLYAETLRDFQYALQDAIVECSQSLGFDQVTDFPTWAETWGQTGDPELGACWDSSENKVLEEFGVPEGG